MSSKPCATTYQTLAQIQVDLNWRVGCEQLVLVVSFINKMNLACDVIITRRLPQSMLQSSVVFWNHGVGCIVFQISDASKALHDVNQG